MRTLHLLDIENLCRGEVTTDSVATALARFVRFANVQPDDHVIVGTGPRAAGVAWFSLPRHARRVLGHGVDGAEKALIHAAEPAHVAARYGRVVIGSGDHCFASLVRDLRLRGVEVLIAGAPGCTSRQLRLVAA